MKTQFIIKNYVCGGSFKMIVQKNIILYYISRQINDYHIIEFKRQHLEVSDL